MGATRAKQYHCTLQKSALHPLHSFETNIYLFSDTRKQVQQGWGGESGEKAWDDERVGETIAKADENAEPQTPAEEVEEADKSKSYSDYLAEKAAKDSLAAVQLLLATLRESSDPCPPLKGVVGGLAKVMELIEVCVSSHHSAICVC